MHTYLISKWYGCGSDQTACAFRTNDPKQFYDKIKELQRKHDLTNENTRLIEREDLTIFSFPENEEGEAALLQARMWSEPKKYRKAFAEVATA